ADDFGSAHRTARKCCSNEPFDWPTISGTAARSICRWTDSPWRTSTSPTGYDAVPARPAENFAGTPYASAPPQVQRDVILSAQNILARRGLYRGAFDGNVSPDLEFSLRAYQARARLPVTGRLDLDTLAALQLLPGANAPI